MKLALVTYGTEGDVRPLATLAAGLMASAMGDDFVGTVFTFVAAVALRGFGLVGQEREALDLPVADLRPVEPAATALAALGIDPDDVTGGAEGGGNVLVEVATAGAVPEGARPELLVRVRGGRVVTA